MKQTDTPQFYAFSSLIEIAENMRDLMIEFDGQIADSELLRLLKIEHEIVNVAKDLSKTFNNEGDKND